MRDYDIEVQKVKRLTLLYYLDIPIPFPYSDIFKAFDDFYNCHEMIEISDTSERVVLCGLDKDSNIIFVLNKKETSYNTKTPHNYVTMIYTEKHSDILELLEKNMRHKNKPSRANYNILEQINKMVAKRNGIEYEHITYYNSKGYYMERLKLECVKCLKVQNLGTLPEGNSPTF